MAGVYPHFPVPSFYPHLLVSSCFRRTWQIGVPSPAGSTPFVWWSQGLKQSNNGHLQRQPGDMSLCVQILLVVFNNLYHIHPQKKSRLMTILSHHFLKLWMTKTRMRLWTILLMRWKISFLVRKTKLSQRSQQVLYV